MASYYGNGAPHISCAGHSRAFPSRGHFLTPTPPDAPPWEGGSQGGGATSCPPHPMLPRPNGAPSPGSDTSATLIKLPPQITGHILRPPEAGPWSKPVHPPTTTHCPALSIFSSCSQKDACAGIRDPCRAKAPQTLRAQRRQATRRLERAGQPDS